MIQLLAIVFVGTNLLIAVSDNSDNAGLCPRAGQHSAVVQPDPDDRGAVECQVLKRQVRGWKPSRDAALSEASFWLSEFGCPERGCKKINVLGKCALCNNACASWSAWCCGGVERLKARQKAGGRREPGPRWRTAAERPAQMWRSYWYSNSGPPVEVTVSHTHT